MSYSSNQATWVRRRSGGVDLLNRGNAQVMSWVKTDAREYQWSQRTTRVMRWVADAREYQRDARTPGVTRQTKPNNSADFLFRDNTGSVSIEATLMLPLFLVTIFLIMEGSLWVYASTVAQAAAQDGVRAATAYLGSTAEGIKTASEILEKRATGQDWTIIATPGGGELTITVTGKAPTVVPGLELPVRESASLPWENP